MPLYLQLLLVCIFRLPLSVDTFLMHSVISSVSASPQSVVDSMIMTTNDSRGTSEAYDKSNPRSCIFRVGECAGRLCGVSNTHLESKPSENNIVLVDCMSELLKALMDAAASLNLDLILAIRNKLALNKRKYPVELCKGRAGKYTQYSDQTGVTKDNQSTESEIPQSPISLAQFLEEMPALAQEIKEFATERNWAQYHKPRNLILALLGEVGELAELVQWKGDEDISLSSQEIDKLSQELADVSIYLLRIATVCDVVPQLGSGLEAVDH